MTPCFDLEGGTAVKIGVLFWKILDILFEFYKEDNYAFTNFAPNRSKVMSISFSV